MASKKEIRKAALADEKLLVDAALMDIEEGVSDLNASMRDICETLLPYRDTDLADDEEMQLIFQDYERGEFD